MTDDPDLPSPSRLKAWRSVVDPGAAPELMREILKKASVAGAEVLVVDGARVFGLGHLDSAVFHARRAIDEGRNSSDSVAMEALLYASGERQLNSAIAKMGVTEETTEVVAAFLSDEGFDMGVGWEVLPSTWSLDNDRLVAFGITEQELGTVGPERRSELVLEMVAAVDLLKK